MAEKLVNIQDGDILFMKCNKDNEDEIIQATEVLSKRLADIEVNAFIFIGEDPLEISKIGDDVLERAGLKRIEKSSSWAEWWLELFYNLRGKRDG